jgi:membrane-bound lytic murein transglycosylase B
MRTRLAPLIIGLAVALSLCGSAPAEAARKKTKAKARPVKAAASNPERDGIAAHYDQRPEVQAFIEELNARHGFEAHELSRVFASVRYLPVVARLMRPAPVTQPKSWTAYRGRFIEPTRINAGVRFWTDNSSTLTRAALAYGVPEDIIVGITGVETIYGRNTGSFRVIDSLTTLAFDYPNKERDRSPFFKAQLEDYLLFARDGRLDYFDVRGSYAGAIGIPQFMPGSYRRYAVDFDGDQTINLRSNTADAIGSVANFLREHGWVRGMTIFYPTVLPADLDSSELKRLIALGSDPKISAGELRKLGFVIDASVTDPDLLALIDLPNEGEAGRTTEYVLGTQNFAALTRYNRSYFYAMAVAELGSSVRAAMAR